MWLTWRLAWRHLVRSRRRSLLTVLAVLFPVLMLDLMWGMSGAMRRNLFESVTLLETGHIQVHRAGYRKQGNTPPLLPDVRTILAALEQESAVRRFSVRLELPALAAHGNRSQGVIVRGVAPGEQGLNPVARWVHEGRSLQPEDHKVAVAGVALLRKLNATLGDPLVLITSHPQAGTGVLLPTVVGTIDPPSRELSRFVVQIPLHDARALVKNPQAATSVVLLLGGVSGVEDQERIDVVAQRLQTALGEEYAVETWDELSPETATMFNIVGPLYAAFGMIFFVLAGLVVLNTLYLSVVERTRELGVVLALGSSRRLVLAWIETEAALLAGLGCVLGSALGVLIVRWGGQGFSLPGLYNELMNTLGISATLYTRLSLIEGLFSGVAMFLVALVAAYYPGWRAARLEPVEAMRFWG